MKRITALTSLALTLAACAASNRIPSGRSLEPGSAYVAALQRATRRAEHIESLELHTYVYATLLTPEFTSAFDAEYREVYGTAAVPPLLGADGDRTLILAVATNDRAISNLSSFGRLWNLTYADGTTTVAPRRMERFAHDALFLRYFFPYWNPWQEVFSVSFALPASTTTGGVVELNGVGGHIRLNW